MTANNWVVTILIIFIVVFLGATMIKNEETRKDNCNEMFNELDEKNRELYENNNGTSNDLDKLREIYNNLCPDPCKYDGCK